MSSCTTCSLADQLYRTDTHFVLEFVQNAEDNAYLSDVTPTLSLRIEDYTMTISCNERGFDESNVRALCNIGTSTKKHLQGFIGTFSLLVLVRKDHC